MADIIETDLSERVLTITMDDPERLNPLTREDYLAMFDAFRAGRESDARCVVLEGAGEAFSSGYDIDAMGEGEDAGLHEQVEGIQANEHRLAREILTHPLPTVAKIDGPAVGDAAGFAIACDVPLASERAKIGFSHVRFGLSLDCGVSYVLPRLVGRGLAMELALTGRIVDAERAREVGLVNHVFPTETFEERADGIVREIADGPPIAHRHIKRLIVRGQETTLREALFDEARSQVIASNTRDYREAVGALRADETPQFEGR